MPAKAFKKAVPPEEVIEGKKQQIELLTQQCNAVERMLAISTDQQRRIEAETEDLLRRSAANDDRREELEKGLEENVKTLDTITRTSAEQLKHRYENLKKTVADAQAENAQLRAKLKDTVERKEAELRKWKDEVAEQQRLIDEKALMFGIQLKETLSRVRA